MGEMIKIRSAATDHFEFPAYHAAPSGERKGGVIVIQEIFGIDEHVRRDVDRWASLGYEAVAPGLYDRREPGFTAHHDEAGIPGRVAHAMASPREQVARRPRRLPRFPEPSRQGLRGRLLLRRLLHAGLGLQRSAGWRRRRATMAAWCRPTPR